MADEAAQRVEEFFASYPVRKYNKGQILILNGDEPGLVYYLVRGKVKQYDITYRGEEIVLNVFKPRAFFPMSFALNGGTSPYIFEAETAVELRQAPAGKVVEFIKSDPEVLLDLLSRVYRGTDSLIGRMVQLMSGSAKSRLIYELLTEARRFGDIREDGSCLLAINEKDLGARAGLSRETVSRIIAALKTEGLVEVTPKGIRIKQVRFLEDMLGSGDFPKPGL